jgi:hypothetical protein
MATVRRDKAIRMLRGLDWAMRANLRQMPRDVLRDWLVDQSYGRNERAAIYRYLTERAKGVVPERVRAMMAKRVAGKAAILADSMLRLPIANPWGNVDVQGLTPEGYVHVDGERLQPLCRKLGVRYAVALTGWSGSKKYRKPVLDGVVGRRLAGPQGRYTILGQRRHHGAVRRGRVVSGLLEDHERLDRAKEV